MPEGRPSRWAVWRSPADQPRWARPALLGIAFVWNKLFDGHLGVAIGCLTFSVGDVAHTAYVASLAPPVAALSGLGIGMFWRAYRRGGRQAGYCR